MRSGSWKARVALARKLATILFGMMRDGTLCEARPYPAWRPGRTHGGKVVVMRFNLPDLRWCSDGFEFACWNGDIARAAFAIDAHDREIIAWKAVANAGVSGSDVRDMMPEAVEKLNLNPCFTPAASPESNGMSEAFVKTIKRNYVRINPIPDAATALDQIAGWFEDYNENHPRSGLKMHAPREFRGARQPANLSG